jgi:hypothetical protein
MGAQAMPRAVKPAPATAPTIRREALRDGLLDCVDKLHRRRACDIPDGFIDDYVSLNWLEWHGGGLRLTATGENVCSQLTKGRSLHVGGTTP